MIITIIIVIFAAGIASALLPKYTLDECKGKDNVLIIFSRAMLLLIGLVLMILISDLLTIILSASAGAVLIYALNKKVKHDLNLLLLGLSLGLTANPLIAYLIIIHLIPTLSLLSMKLISKKKGVKPGVINSLKHLAVFAVTVLAAYYLITVQKPFITGLSAGGLIISGIFGLRGVIKCSMKKQ